MDGWNREKLESTGLMDVLLDIRKVDYELQNCVRGCETDAETYSALGEVLQKLSERLNSAATDVVLLAEDAYDDEDE